MTEAATPAAAHAAIQKPVVDDDSQEGEHSSDVAQQIAALQAEYRSKYKAKLLEMKSFYEAQLNDVCAQLEDMKARLNASRQCFEQQEQEKTAVWQENAAIKQENAQLRAHATALSDKLGRTASEFDNYRKRVVRDQEQYKNQAEERIIAGFLPVMDNLERALQHARQASDYEQLLQGVELTGKMYLAALGKYGCVPFDSLGAVCDPHYHDVLQRVVDSEVPHNTVVQEHLKGYLMHDRVLRPALVVVAQHGDSEEGGE
ncbi:MAG: nucleotide exchange factor GrpE [Proteobacteria bacterium]|nr:nucleotide exchange factor GrpE [Pseudomonadota bacterium]